MTKKDGYLSIHPEALTGGETLPFDTFIRVGAKFVLYLRNGDKPDQERIERLQKKADSILFIKAEDETAYRLYLQRGVESAYTRMLQENMPEKARQIFDFNCAIARTFMDDLESQPLYIAAQGSAANLYQFVTTETDSLKVTFEIPNLVRDVAQHGVRVATLTCVLARELEIDNLKPMAQVVVGCFIHDLEFHYTDFDFKRPVTSFTAEELKTYKLHPNASAKRVQSIPFIDPTVKQIILQHEEHFDGTGFPRGLKAEEMDAIIGLVGIANSFDRLLTFEKLSAKDALKKLLIDKMGAYPLEHLQLLQKTLKSVGIVA